MTNLIHTLEEYFTLDRALAVLAIGFATKQFLDARSSDQRMKQHSQKMQEIATSMSTRFIGAFPANMPEIKNVVESAETSLEVMVDYCGYGHFSAPSMFRSYLSTILEKHRSGVNIRIVVYGEKLLSQSNESEFPAEQFEELKHTKEFYDFFHVHSRGLKVPTTPLEFREMLIERQRAYLTEVQIVGIPVRTVDQDLVVFAWIEDGEDAVFSFRGAGIKNDREVAFRTRDGKLIQTFGGLFEKIWHQGIPLLPKPLLSEAITKSE